jgi:hypothetical protein
MKPAKAQKIIDKALPGLVDALCLGSWRIVLVAEKLEGGDGAQGLCRIWPEYMVAKITICCKSSKKHILETLRHELIHLTLASFDQHGQIVAAAIPSALADVVAESNRAATERAVVQIEWILDRAKRQKTFDDLWSSGEADSLRRAALKNTTTTTGEPPPATLLAGAAAQVEPSKGLPAGAQLALAVLIELAQGTGDREDLEPAVRAVESFIIESFISDSA